MSFAVFIIRHGIMCRIQDQFGDIDIRKQFFHGKPSIQKNMRIMSGCRSKYWKNRKIIHGIRGSKHV